MRKIILFICAIISAVNVSAAWSQEKADAFLTAMERVYDPGNIGKNVKSLEMECQGTALKFNVKMDIDIFYKAPDKLKTVCNTAGLQTLTVYFNGTKGVRVDSIGGVSPVEGLPLKELKMQAIRMNPALPLRQAYEKVEIMDELEERNGKKYVAIVCSSKASDGLFPQKFLVDPDTKLVVYSIGKTHSEMGSVEVVTHNVEYKKINGFVVPVRSVQTMMNISVETVLKRFEINKIYPDSLFEYQER